MENARESEHGACEFPGNPLLDGLILRQSRSISRLEKVSYLAEVLRYRDRWQAGKENASIAARAKTWIAQHQYSAVRCVADESTHALLQCDDRLGQLMFEKRVSAPLPNGPIVRLEYGVGR